MNEVANTTVSVTSKFKLPAPAATRETIAAALGFKSISAVRATPKTDPMYPKVKEYAKAVGDAAEVVEVSTSFPEASSVPTDQVQELIASIARNYHRAAILNARRKGEELPLAISYQIYDLMGIDEDDGDDGEYDKDAIQLALDSYCKARGLNEASTLLMQCAVVGTKTSMLKLRKFFAVMQQAQEKFASWIADNTIEGVDFDSVAFWLKRQNKRLQSAIATPEIDETEISF